MSDIFISYASEDEQRVAPLALALVELGFSVWWDRQIPPGKTFDEVIETALDDAKAVVVVWTTTGVASRWVRTEAAEGLARRILVPVLFDDVRIPLAFRRIQAADLTEWEPGQEHREFSELIEAIEQLIAAAEEPEAVEPVPIDPSERDMIAAQDRAAEGDWSSVATLLEPLEAEDPQWAEENPEAAALLALAQRKRRAADLYEEAEVLYSDGRWQQVIARIDRVLEMDPEFEYDDTLQRRAQRHLERARNEEIEGGLRRAQDALQAREWVVAVTRFQDVLEADPDRAEAAAGLDQARSGARAERRYGDLAEAFRRGDWQDVIAGIAELEDSNPEFGDPDGLADRANQRLAEAEAGETQEAPAADADQPTPQHIATPISPPTRRAAPSEERDQPTPPAEVGGASDRDPRWKFDRSQWKFEWNGTGGYAVGVVAAILVAVIVIVAVAAPEDDGGGPFPAGTTVSVLADDLSFDWIGAALAPFEDSSGITFDIVGAGDDPASQLRVMLEGGAAPDLALIPRPRVAADLVAEGAAVALPPEVVDIINQNFDPGWEMVPNVGEAIFGVPVQATLGSVVWYSPSSFARFGYEIPQSWDELLALQDRMVADGNTPWGIGIESRTATGWVFTNWMEDLVLRFHGPQVYDQWVAHEIPFTDPRVRDVVETMSSVWFTDRYVLGGRERIVDLPFEDAGLCVATGECMMHHQGGWYQSYYRNAGYTPGPDADVDVFPLPPVAGDSGVPVLASGVIAIAFTDRPEVIEALRIMATVEFGDSSIDAALPGSGMLSANRNQDLNRYRDDFDRRMAELLVGADIVRFDASDYLPGISADWWSAGAAYVVGEISIDEFLERVEAAWP